MNKKLTTLKLIIVVCFTFFNSYTQSVQGIVFDMESKQPLDRVNVTITNTNCGASTNTKGEFQIECVTPQKASDSIRFSILGYLTSTLSLKDFARNNYKVYLLKSSEQLNQVTVTQKRELNKKLPFKKIGSSKRGVYNFGSVFLNNEIYVIGGDRSFVDDSQKRVLDEVSNLPQATLNDILKKLATSYSWEGYNDKLQTYNMATGEWSMLDLNLRQRAYHRAVNVNNEVYILGGKVLSVNKKKEYLDDKIEILNLETNEIRVDNTNPHQGINFAAFAFQDNIIVMGGSTKMLNNGEKEYTKKSHIYNTSSGYWYELKEMTKPKEVNGILIDNKIYLIGGFYHEPLTEIESYNVTTGTWQKEGDLFSGIKNPALANQNQIVYIFNDGKFYTLNLSTKILNEYHINLNLETSQMYCYNNKLYIFGGFKNIDFSKSASSNLYVIDLKDLKRTEIFNSKRII